MAHADYIVRMRYFRCLALLSILLASPVLAQQPVIEEPSGDEAIERREVDPGQLGQSLPEAKAPEPSGEAAATQAALTQSAPTEADSVNKLLNDLKRERDPQAAQRIASRLFTLWSKSDSATVNLLLEWADTAIKEKRNAAALDFLDQAITLAPDFAGAWNKRATLHYTLGEQRKSMADINRVLALEPRNFGALAGMASILREAGRKEMALRAWERYLEIYPTDRQAQEVVTTLSEELAGSRL